MGCCGKRKKMGATRKAKPRSVSSWDCAFCGAANSKDADCNKCGAPHSRANEGEKAATQIDIHHSAHLIGGGKTAVEFDRDVERRLLKKINSALGTRIF